MFDHLNTVKAGSVNGETVAVDVQRHPDLYCRTGAELSWQPSDRAKVSVGAYVVGSTTLGSETITSSNGKTLDQPVVIGNNTPTLRPELRAEVRVPIGVVDLYGSVGIDPSGQSHTEKMNDVTYVGVGIKMNIPFVD